MVVCHAVHAPLAALLPVVTRPVAGQAEACQFSPAVLAAATMWLMGAAAATIAVTATGGRLLCSLGLHVAQRRKE